MYGENGAAPEMAGYCNHGNKKSFCKKCKAEEKGDELEYSQQKFDWIAEDVDASLKELESRQAAGGKVTYEEVYDLMLKMDSDLIDQASGISAEWRKNNPDFNGKPIPEGDGPNGPIIDGLYGRRNKLFDLLPRSTWQGPGKAAEGIKDIPEGGEQQDTLSEFVEATATEATKDALKDCKYKDVSFSAANDEKLVAHLMGLQEMGYDVVSIGRGESAKFMCKAPVSSEQGTRLIQERGYKVVGGNKTAAELRSTMEELLKQPGKVKKVEFNRNTVLVG